MKTAKKHTKPIDHLDELARLGWEAYSGSTGGVSAVTGAALPTWDELKADPSKESVVRAWVAVAVAYQRRFREVTAPIVHGLIHGGISGRSSSSTPNIKLIPRLLRLKTRALCCGANTLKLKKSEGHVCGAHVCPCGKTHIPWTP